MSTKSNYKISYWILSLLFFVAITIAGFGINLLINSLIPLWLLLGFSIIFSIEKWFIKYTLKYKIAGKIYRIILNLSLISLLALLIWSGVLLFTQQFMQNAIIGSLLFVAEIIFFIWIIKIVKRNSWRWPSMKLTFLCIIALFLIFSFAGVSPFKTYKDNIISSVSNISINTANRYNDRVIISDYITVELGEISVDRSKQQVHIFCIVNPGKFAETNTEYNINILWNGESIGAGIANFKTLKIIPFESFLEVERGDFREAIICLEEEQITQYRDLLVETPEYKALLSEKKQLIEEKQSLADKEEEITYNLFLKGESPSYDEYKKITERIEYVNNRLSEINKGINDVWSLEIIPDEFINSLELVVEK
jgi:signal transduction histidine kinase